MPLIRKRAQRLGQQHERRDTNAEFALLRDHHLAGRTDPIPRVKIEEPGKVIFAIFTDGLENASRKFTWQDIADDIRKRRDKDGWEFLFLGANQDAIATAAQMNIHAHDAATASYSEEGVRGSSRAFSRKIRAMRSSLDADPAAAPHEDLAMPMSDLLKEEEERDSEN